MKRISNKALIVAGIGLVAAFGLARAAYAQAQTASSGVQRTPFNYEIKDGKRVPKANRVTNADGSWREEVRQGSCVTIKEGSPQGEVKITRTCDGGSAR